MTFVTAMVKRTGVTNIATSIDATISADGSTPIDANDIVGGLTTKTVPFAANVTADQPVSWEVVGDSAVEPDEGFKVTLSNPSAPGGTISAPVARGTIMNDDNTAPASAVVFGPQNTGDTNKVVVGSTSQLMEHTFKAGKTASIYMLGLDDDGNGFALFQQQDNRYQLRKVTSYSVGDVNNGNDGSVLTNSSIVLGFVDNDKLGFQIIAGKANMLKNGVPYADEYGFFPYTLPGSPALGQNARYKKYFGDDITGLTITRK